MVFVQLLLRAICHLGWRRLRWAVPPVVVVAAALAGTGAAGLHLPHAVLSAGMHLLDVVSSLNSTGGPPNP